LLAQHEFYSMMNKAGIPVFRFVGMACGTAMISSTFWTIGPNPIDLASGYKWENMVLVATLLFMFIRQFPQKHNDKPLSTIACSLLGVWYVPLLFNYFTRLTFAWQDADMAQSVGRTGQMLILYLVLVVKISDVGAYFTGRQFGKHKLFPRLSPKKTWEGFVGGVVFSLVASIVFCMAAGWRLGTLTFGLSDAILMGLLLPVVGILGDLFESLVKRAAAVKDSGSTIPGMGGVLDVLDSLLFGAPVLYVYVRLFV
ncbi:CDP-archaeol synthase, partial [PVC group bacterium]|nr:CDP-archaeol synthase [PVC group bacterium]